MNLVQITPGAGAMFCGNCFRDNALVAELRKLGHSTLMVPLYLPLTLDEEDQTRGTPIFFNGINVYLEQKSGWFRRAPAWVHRLASAGWLLKFAAARAARTRAAGLGEITLSIIRGEDGNQARELDQLIAFLKTQPRPDIICLSNVLLAGLARRLKSELRAPIACVLQGEDAFLDALPDSHRDLAWRTLADRCADIDLFMPPTQYFARRMTERLRLPAARVRVIFDGINLQGYDSAPKQPTPDNSTTPTPSPRSEARGEGWGEGHLRNQTNDDSSSSSPPPSPPFHGGEGAGSATEIAAAQQRRPTAELAPPQPVLGYFARMCKEKGLDTLIEAFIILKERNRVKNLRLKVGGGCGPADEPFVTTLRAWLRARGFLNDAEFCPNVDRAGKQAFLRSLTVFSVPALYGEAFGLYVIEALASGVPVVQPRHAAFPELVEESGGGVLCEPGDPAALADAIESLLLDPARARALGEAGRRSVREKFSAAQMARETIRAYEEVCGR